MRARATASTPLALAAAERGAPGSVERCSRRGADVNVASPEGETPLMIARAGRPPDAVDGSCATRAARGRQRPGSWKGQIGPDVGGRRGSRRRASRSWSSGRRGRLHAQSKAGFTAAPVRGAQRPLAAVRHLLTLGADPNDRGRAPQARRLERSRQHQPPAPARGGESADLGARDVRSSTPDYELAVDAARSAAPIRNSPIRAARSCTPSRSCAGRARATRRCPPGQWTAWTVIKALLARAPNPTRGSRGRRSRSTATRGDPLPPNIPVGRNFLSFIGATPFYLAAKHGDVAMMRVLMANRADPKMHDRSGRDAADGGRRTGLLGR